MAGYSLTNNLTIKHVRSGVFQKVEWELTGNTPFCIAMTIDWNNFLRLNWSVARWRVLSFPIFSLRVSAEILDRLILRKLRKF